MPDEQQWTIEFYVDEQGNEPVREFLDGLDLKTQVRFAWSIEQLRVRNVHATEPLVKHIDGKIWELRRASSGNIYRLMYFFFTGQTIVFLHGFTKKTQKTPTREIEVAQKHLDDYVQRKGGK